MTRGLRFGRDFIRIQHVEDLLRPWMLAKGRERSTVIVNEDAAYWYA